MASPAKPGPPVLDFLRNELASTPRRQRATLRIVLACLVAITLIAGFHIPEGHWFIMTIFTVSLPDAGASLIKGLRRMGGTLAGGAMGIVVVIMASDQPWLLFPAIGIGSALGLFVARASTAPYAGIMGTVTFVLVALAHLQNPVAAVEVGLWRIFGIALSVVIATAVQLLVWPDDPEELLLDDLARRLAAVDSTLGRLLAGPLPPAGGAVPIADILTASGLSGQLDLLAGAEARHPAIRRRHVEQTALIIEVERLVTGSLWLEHLDRQRGAAAQLSDAVRARVAALRDGCASIHEALRARRPASGPERAPGSAPPPLGTDGAPGAFLAALRNMEQSLSRIPAATSFLAHPYDAPGSGAHVPALDAPTSTSLFVGDFSTRSAAAIRYAFKGALAIEVSYLIMVGLAWPSIFTCVVTCVVVAQSTFGATVNKSMFRVAGALLGALLAFLVIVLVMPNIETLVPYLVTMCIGFGVAAWLNTGSSRISYVGLQAATAFALGLVDAFAPTTDLLPARDRVLGILLGIAVMLVVDHTVWPVRASRSMRSTLASALRSLAALAAMPLTHLGYAGRVARSAELRGGVYRDLAATLRLREESEMEPGAGTLAAHAEREHALRVAGGVQAVFLALLVLARHRLTSSVSDLPGPLVRAIDRFHEALGQALIALAAAVEAKPSPAAPDLTAALDDLDRAIEAALDGKAEALGSEAAASAHGLLALDREVVELVSQLGDDVAEAPVPAASTQEVP
jgi:multidrug resistance protein MdtO